VWLKPIELDGWNKLTLQHIPQEHLAVMWLVVVYGVAEVMRNHIETNKSQRATTSLNA
jgi:hypothetical protein